MKAKYTMKNAKYTMKNQRGASRIALLAGGVVLGLLVLAAALYGPELVGYYRFNNAVEAFARNDEVNGGKWPRVSEACIVCHGYNGNTVTQLYPRLAGQPAAYLVQQLTAFAGGQRASPIMAPLAKTMSAAELKHLADYYATQAPARNAAFVADPAKVGKGEALAKAGNCAACHGANLAGHDQFPRLAGQGYDYLVEQLAAFKNGRRRDPSGAMTTVAAGLSGDDIQNLGQYLAAQ